MLLDCTNYIFFLFNRTRRWLGLDRFDSSSVGLRTLSRRVKAAGQRGEVRLAAAGAEPMLRESREEVMSLQLQLQ